MRLPAAFVPAALALTTSAISLAQAPAYGPVSPQPGPPPPGTAGTSGYTTPSTGGYTASPLPDEPVLPEQPQRAEQTGEVEHGGERWKDAHVDRVVLVPTAETHPEGTFYIGSYELVLPQVGYAVSDRTQITLTGSPPFGEDHIFFLDASLKTVLTRQERFRLAAIGSMSGLFGMNEGSAIIGRAGVTAQFCFDHGCKSSANLATTWVLAGPATIDHTGLGIIWRVSRAFAFLLEANTFMPFTREAGRFNAILIGPGGRLSWANFGVDLAFEWVADAEVEEGESVPVLPVLALTYRFLP